MTLLFAFGTRPEIIKLAPVIAEAKRRRQEVILCSTGQHREMLDQALSLFALRPDIALAAMEPGQKLPTLAARLIETLGEAFAKAKPDIVLVQGDTMSAFAAAMAAFYLEIPVGHVEAGLRTFDMRHPFPEELNRTLIARLARWHFAPTENAAANLKKEGVPPEAIFLCGNTGIDALSLVSETLPASLEGRDFVLVTAHRRENFGEPLLHICAAIRALCQRHAKLQFVFPVHLNPNVRKVIFAELSNIANLQLLEPVDYSTNIALERHARLVITDSGGIQEEAPSFGTPLVIMREHTERMEGVDAEFAILAGTETDAIIAAAERFLSDGAIKQTLGKRANPYGDGKASQRILSILLGEPAEMFRG